MSHSFRDTSPGRLRPAVLLLAVLGVAGPGAGTLRAQVFESVGARALGMGGAFVAVADDGTATYWNPAGLGASAVVDACAGYGRTERVRGEGTAAPAGQEARTTSVCLALPVIAFSYNSLAIHSAGVPVNSTAADPGSRQDLRPQGVGVSSLRTRQFGLSLVQSVLPGVVLGATVKVVRGDAGAAVGPSEGGGSRLEDARGLAVATSTRFDADIGVMAGGGPFRVGLVVRNVRQPSFAAPAGERLELARQARVGLAWTPGRLAAANRSDPAGFIVAVDADVTATPTADGDRRNVAAGVERWWAGRRLGVRAGARASTIGDARPVATAGVSIGLTRTVLVEAAGTRGRSQGDRGWFVGIRAGL